MTLPTNVRVNVSAPWPARVTGAGLVTVTKANGIWTISVGSGGDVSIGLVRVTASGPTIGQPTDAVILFDKVANETSSYQLVNSSVAKGDVVIKDYKGNALTYQISITSSGETIDKTASPIILNSNFAVAILSPIPGVGWYVKSISV